MLVNTAVSGGRVKGICEERYKCFCLLDSSSTSRVVLSVGDHHARVVLVAGVELGEFAMRSGIICSILVP